MYETADATRGVVSPLVERVHTPCGVCGSSEREPFHAFSDVVRCLDCGVLYVSPRPSSAAIERFYSRAGHYDHWDREPGRKAMWRRRVQRLLRLCSGGRLLDVGTGQGDFGAAAREYFTFEGTEISSEGVRLARERHGLTVYHGDLLDLDLPRGAYDVITLWHVLEHVLEPRKVVERCYALLKPGGIFAVAVPNTDYHLNLSKKLLASTIGFALGRPMFREVGFPRLLLESPEEEIHLTHFTLASLCWLLRSKGFLVCERGLDDYSADNSLRARYEHYKSNLFFQMTGFASSPAIFAAGRKPTP
ncbi:MAG: class I SAM-dependent methyltransferase [Myxococcales bacterium]|nr:class I SAM-dependent methyltransferase [Polyangiaceae bacterium]MDW8251701.1 class I SAM-dependent methyltransferase [Myxococcales bacterium]